MKLRNLIYSCLCFFLLISDTNAMTFNKPTDSVHFLCSGKANNTTMFELCRNVQQLKKDMNGQMLKFHRGIQSFEADVYTQAIALRQHFWQLEIVVEDQVSKEINAKIGEQVSELHWPQWTIESERNEPLFQLRQNIQQFGITFRSRTTQLMRDLQQLSQKVSHYKSKSYKKRTFKLNQDVEQFNITVDEHLFGLHNDIKRLGSVIEEQIFELNQDINSLKSKIDVSWSELRKFETSGTYASWPDYQSPKSNIYISWQTLRQYVRCLEFISDKNMRGLRQDVNSLRTYIYEDISSLHQSAISLQTNICGEFSYKCNRFLKYR